MAVRPRAHVTRLCKGKYFRVSLVHDYVRQANFTTKSRLRTIVFALYFTLFVLGCSFQLSLTPLRTHARTHSRAHSLTHPLTLSTSLSRLGHKPSINRLHSSLSTVLACSSAHLRPSSSSHHCSPPGVFWPAFLFPVGIHLMATLGILSLGILRIWPGYRSLWFWTILP